MIPYVRITTVDGTMPGVPAGASLYAVAGPAMAGTASVAYGPFARKDDVIAALGAGPLVEMASMLTDAGLPVLCFRTPTSIEGTAGEPIGAVAGTCSAVTHHGTGASVGSIHTNPTPSAVFSVVVLFPVGGTIGTEGIVYQTSLDGGATYTVAAALGTAAYITIAGAGGVRIDFTTATIVAMDSYTFTTTAPIVASDGSLVVDFDAGSTCVPTINGSSAPYDDFECGIRFQTGGSIHTAGITYQTTRDGGRNWSSEVYALGTATSITLAGVIVDLADGSITAEDELSFWTTAPESSSGDLAATTTALEATAQPWDALVLVTPVTAAIGGALDTLVIALEEDGEPRRWIAPFRLPTYGETHSDYVAAAAVLSASYRSPLGRGTVVAGAAEVVSAVSRCVYRRSAMFAAVVKWLSVSEEVNIAQIDPPGGLLTGASITYDNGDPKHHDEWVTPGLDDLGYMVLRTMPQQGKLVFVNRPLVFSPASSDFKIEPHWRIYKLALRTIYGYFLHRLNRGAHLSKRTGYLLPSAAIEMESGAYRSLEAVLTGKASDWTVVLDRNIDLRPAGSRLTGTWGVQCDYYPEGIELTGRLSVPV